VLGLMGVTRRLRVFDDPSLQIWFVLAALGALLIAAGIGALLVQIAYSIWKRNELRDTTGDPWNARTLEWATSSPPPDYNFAFTPVVHDNDAWYDMKSRGYQRPLQGFKPIHMPKNTGAGIILSAFATALGFALIWYMWLFAAVCFTALVAGAIYHTFNYKRDFHIPVDQVINTEAERTKLLSAQVVS